MRKACRINRNAPPSWPGCLERAVAGRYPAITIPIRNGWRRAVRGTPLRPFLRIPVLTGHLGLLARQSPHAHHAPGPRPEGNSVFSASSASAAPSGTTGAPPGRGILRPAAALLLSGLVAATALVGAGPAAADEPGR